MAERIIKRMNSKSNIITKSNIQSKNMNYIIDTSAAKEFGFKPEKMIDIVDMVCANYE